MANKTIYVSENDEPIFEKAKNIAGEGLSSVISKALKEFVLSHEKNLDNLKEITIKIGSDGAQREQRFVGKELYTWKGFDDNKEWWMEARVYVTKKNNWAIHIAYICRASLLLDKKKWKEEGEYLLKSHYSKLIILSSTNAMPEEIPLELAKKIQELEEKQQQLIEYLDI